LRLGGAGVRRGPAVDSAPLTEAYALPVGPCGGRLAVPYNVAYVTCLTRVCDTLVFSAWLRTGRLAVWICTPTTAMADYTRWYKKVYHSRDGVALLQNLRVLLETF